MSEIDKEAIFNLDLEHVRNFRQGIYTDQEGKLYYAEGLSVSGRDTFLPNILVKYYPLFDMADARINGKLKGLHCALDYFTECVPYNEGGTIQRFSFRGYWRNTDILSGRILRLKRHLFHDNPKDLISVPEPKVVQVVEVTNDSQGFLVQCITQREGTRFDFYLEKEKDYYSVLG